jgi:sarcosine oxidase
MIDIVGLGVMGSAAAWSLARRGEKVVGYERFAPAHDQGSSHGLTRVIRKAYFEHPAYVPLVLRAYALWAELEKETGRTLYRKTGALMIGRPDSPIVRGSLESARTHGLPHRMLSTSDLRARCPFMTFRDDEVALEEFDAGVLLAEEAVQALQAAAIARGADLRFGTEASIDPARRTIVTAGAWLPSLVPGLPLKIERQTIFWFDTPEPVPLFIWDRDGQPFFTIPDIHGHGLKCGFHHGGEITTAEAVHREIRREDVDVLRARLRETVPSLDREPRRSSVCMYTNTPDEKFILGVRGQLVLGSPCSGHGFKFAPVVGEILGDLAASGATRHPIDLFRPDRFRA